MKIGIVTFHRAFNYGANLQAFALNSYVNQMGYDCEIIDLYPNNAGRPSSNAVRRLLSSAKLFLLCCKDKRTRRFTKFQKENYRLSLNKYYGDADMNASSPRYDVLISGSDQVLNTTLTGETKSYYLSFDNKAKKISYGSSFGRATLSEIGITSTLVLDPVFLLSKEKWNEKSAKCVLPNKYILVYAMETTKLLESTVKVMSERLGLPVYIIYGCTKRYISCWTVVEDCGPSEFVSYIKGASVIITNSFHGTAFSIIFEKKFVCVAHSTRNARLDNIMEIIGQQNNLVKDETSFPEIIDGKEASVTITPYIKASKDYLMNALES